MTAGKLSQAINVLDEFLATNPDSALAWYNVAQLYLQNGDLAAANTAAERTVALAPDDPRAALISAQIEVSQGRRELALRNLVTLAQRFPQDGRVLKALARLQIGVREFEAARETLAKIVETDSSDLVALELWCDVTTRLGQIGAALDCASRLISRSPESRTGFSIRGRALMVKGASEAAAKAFQSAYRLSNHPYDLAFLVRAQIASNTGEPVILLRERLAQDSKDIGLRLLLAEVHMKQGETDLAVSEYEAVLAAAPINALAANNLAWLLKDSEPKRAQEVALRAARNSPENADVLDTAGWILLNNGDTSAAVKFLRQAADLGTNNPEVLYHLAVALERSGAIAEATQVLQNALRLDSTFPSREDAKSLLNAIERHSGDGSTS